jgi:hypothetical protein
MTMIDGYAPKPPGKVRGWPFEKGRSGNPLGRRVGCCNKTTIAAASLLAGEGQALTRRAVELALAGDPVDLQSTGVTRGRNAALYRTHPAAMPRKFVLPPIESAPTGQAHGLKAHEIAEAMKAVTSALADGMIAPGEAATIAAELAMPDLDLIKQDEQGVWDRRERFTGGRSGNPAGRDGGRHLCPGDRDQLLRTAFAAGLGRPRQPLRTPQSARMAPARIGSTTLRGTLLQIRCRWRGAQQSTQFMDVSSPGRSVGWDST